MPARHRFSTAHASAKPTPGSTRMVKSMSSTRVSGLARASRPDPDIDEALSADPARPLRARRSPGRSGDKIAARVTKAAVGDADVAAARAPDRSVRSRTAAAPPVHSGRRQRRLEPPSMSREPSAVAPSGASSRSSRRPTHVMLRYVNRLSDLLFVLARVVNHRAASRDRVVDRVRP